MSTVLDIVQRPIHIAERKNHVLYTPARKVKIFNTKFKNKVKDLIATMHHEHGVGIAAPQVGWNEQVFVIEASVDSSRYPLMRRYRQLKDVKQQIFINPKITYVSKDYVDYWHGCLSAKGVDRGLVRTYKTLGFSAQNIEGHVFKGTLESLAAIIFQHEFRHLLGTLYCDHAKTFVSLDEMKTKVLGGELDLYKENAEGDVPYLLKDYKIGETIEEYRERTNATDGT